MGAQSLAAAQIAARPSENRKAGDDAGSVVRAETQTVYAARVRREGETTTNGAGERAGFLDDYGWCRSLRPGAQDSRFTW